MAEPYQRVGEYVLLERVAADAPASGFGREGAVKLTDFGLGLAADARQGSILLSVDGDVSRPGQLAGTLEYMSPEQRRGEAVDGRADLYACGVVLYEMLT